eukprot:symbB.v1.2.001826.t1/scaffold97.1/size333048/30
MNMAFARLNAAARLPSLKDLEFVAGALVVMAVLALPVRNFLEPCAPPQLRKVCLTLVRCAIFPCIVEEAFWRVLLLPNANMDGGGRNEWKVIRFFIWSLSIAVGTTWGMLGQMTFMQWLYACTCLTLFVLCHIPSGYALARLGALKDGGRTFSDPRFLWLALVLGMACSLVYLATGSLWASVLVHW